MELVIPAAQDGCEDKLSQTDCITSQYTGNAHLYFWQLGGLPKLDDANRRGALI